MKFRISTLILALVVGMGAWAYSSGALSFNVASVGTTFVSFESETSARDAIKNAIERYDGTLDIAVSDFSDTALQFVLIRLSNDRPIRLLMERGGVTEEAEVAVCQQLNDLFEVRFVDDMNHRFAVTGARSVVMSSMDWTEDNLNSIMPQSVTEIDGESVAATYTEQFNALWSEASSSCTGRITFP